MSARTADIITAADIERDGMALSALMEFDSPIVVDAAGGARQIDYRDTFRPHAPEVWHDDDTRDADAGEGWEFLTGYTGQHGYRGPVMHASEFIGGRMADDILSTPGIYVAVVVGVLPDDADDDPEPAGWAVARYVGEVTR